MKNLVETIKSGCFYLTEDYNIAYLLKIKNDTNQIYVRYHNSDIFIGDASELGLNEQGFTAKIEPKIVSDKLIYQDIIMDYKAICAEVIMDDTILTQVFPYGYSYKVEFDYDKKDAEKKCNQMLAFHEYIVKLYNTYTTEEVYVTPRFILDKKHDKIELRKFSSLQDGHIVWFKNKEDASNARQMYLNIVTNRGI